MSEPGSTRSWLVFVGGLALGGVAVYSVTWYFASKQVPAEQPRRSSSRYPPYLLGTLGSLLMLLLNPETLFDICQVHCCRALQGKAPSNGKAKSPTVPYTSADEGSQHNGQPRSPAPPRQPRQQLVSPDSVLFDLHT